MPTGAKKAIPFAPKKKEEWFRMPSVVFRIATRTECKLMNIKMIAIQNVVRSDYDGNASIINMHNVAHSECRNERCLTMPTNKQCDEKCLEAWDPITKSEYGFLHEFGRITSEK